MPLQRKRACTKAGMSANIRQEMKNGKPQKQAIAIAMSLCERNSKKKGK